LEGLEELVFRGLLVGGATFTFSLSTGL